MAYMATWQTSWSRSNIRAMISWIRMVLCMCFPLGSRTRLMSSLMARILKFLAVMS